MIVRDAILSDERYILANSPAQPGMIRDVPRLVPAPRPVVLPLTALQAPSTVDEPAEVAAAQAPDPVLTLATVSAWLAEQTHDVLCELPTVAAELEEIREDAYTAGRNAGRIDGRAAAVHETLQLHELLKSSIDAVRAECLRAQGHLAAQCVEIVAAAIAQIAGPLLATREAATGAVLTALSRAKAAPELTVRVNPAEFALLETQHAQLAASAATSLQLIADSQVTLGGCLIESQAGTLDARLDVQLQGLFETLRVAQAEAART